MAAVVGANVRGGEQFMVLLSHLYTINVLGGDVGRAYFARTEEVKSKSRGRETKGEKLN
jgi:hypothetical protein